MGRIFAFIWVLRPTLRRIRIACLNNVLGLRYSKTVQKHGMVEKIESVEKIGNENGKISKELFTKIKL